MFDLTDPGTGACRQVVGVRSSQQAVGNGAAAMEASPRPHERDVINLQTTQYIGLVIGSSGYISDIHTHIHIYTCA